MDDHFLRALRAEPRPEFSRRLHERLNRIMKTQTTRRSTLLTWKTALAGAAVALTAALFVSPAARAVAQDFLNLFRVKRFTAVAVDPAVVARLEEGKLDFEALLGDSVETLKEPGQPATVASAEEASQLAGIPVRLPASIPAGFDPPVIQVQGEASLRFTADTARLQAILDTLGVADVKVPDPLNGAVVTLSKPPIVSAEYANGRSRITLAQARNPDISLPDGVRLADLGEIALRVAGMSAEDAQRFAQSIDWNTTLLVPIPANAASFREVEVRGTTGLLVTSDRAAGGSAASGKELPQGSLLLWSEGDIVFALGGNPSGITLVDMANSLQ
jgi:hypothetical protein